MRRLLISSIAVAGLLMLALVPGAMPDNNSGVSPAAANYQIDWQSVNSGGAPTTSTNYQLNSSAGQSFIGYATSTGHQHGIGYWYGVGAEACDCIGWCDLNGDGNINPVDVVSIVNYVYKSIDARRNIPNCPMSQTPNSNGDWTCDGAVNPADVVNYVNYVYKGMTDQPPCDPCACDPYPGNCPPWP